MNYLEFENQAKNFLRKSLKRTTGREIHIRHQSDIKSIDGSVFNIDLSYELEIGKIKYLTIVECKSWKNSVSRDVIMTVEQKRVALKAQKAVVITSGKFQKGAIEYAKNNSIALFQLRNRGQVRQLNHFAGNYKDYEKKLEEDTSPLSVSAEIVGIGIVSPSINLQDYFLINFGINLEEINEEAETGVWKTRMLRNPYEMLRIIPKNWHDEYVQMNTAGLDAVLENESELRIISMWINLSIQDTWA